MALGSHINNIYHKISELQQQLPHPTRHMNTGDIIQINAPDAMDWLDAVPVEIPPQSARDNDYNISVVSTSEINYSEIPELESDSNEEEEEQFEDIQTYLDHHNTYQESQNICKEYTKRLLDLDDERYYRDIDRMYETY